MVMSLSHDLGSHDAQLALGAADGDARAARRIYERHAGLVRGVLTRTLGRSRELEDLVQEVFCRLFRVLPALRDPDALRSFLIGVTLRVARAELRRRHALRWLRLTETGALPERPEPPQLPLGVPLPRLKEALERLGDRARVAFWLHHVEGRALGEVATTLGCSLATVKRDLGRARLTVAR